MLIPAQSFAGCPFGLESRKRLETFFARGVSVFDLGDPAGSFAAEALLQLRRVYEGGPWCLEPDPGHRLSEEFSVLGLVDGFRGGADHLNAVLLEHAHAAEGEGAIQGRLTSHRRQQSKCLTRLLADLLLDDLADNLWGDRLDIGRVGEFRIGHDRRRVGVDQNDPVALFLQRLDGLGAGIVELAGLSDHDRTGSDDQYGIDIRAFRHPGSLAHSIGERNPGAAARPGARILVWFRLSRPYRGKTVVGKGRTTPIRRRKALEVCRVLASDLA